MVERTRVDVLADEAVTLAFFSEVQRVNKGSEVGDRLKLQKLCFLLTHEFFEKLWRGLNYTYFRYRRGPFTKDLYQTEMDFVDSNLMQVRRSKYSLTGQGQKLGQGILSHLLSGQNEGFGNTVTHIAEQYGHLPTHALMDQVYDMQITPIGWHSRERIADIPLYTDLTRMLESDESQTILTVDEHWLESLGVLFEGASEPEREVLRQMPNHPQVMADLKKGIQAFKAGEMVDWNEVKEELGI